MNFEGITEISPSLQADILKHQKTAKANANEWMDSLKSKIMQTNIDIRDFSTTLQSYSDTLLQAIEIEQKDTFVKGIEKFISDIQNNKKGVNQLIAELKGIQTKLNQDQQNFETDDNQIQSQINGKHRALKELQEKIDKYNTDLQKSQSQFDTWKWVAIGGWYCPWYNTDCCRGTYIFQLRGF
ncbi:HBL/NHE enterotoxin family protein [Bacillus cereus]|uniref:HBL/NHE enterotoxin family protein n=1 Tax=Bacillus cereus TaxID=1396 RepID=UPI002921BAE1|nr:Hemolysin BL-binding component [Bacillus cereus]WLE91175.1 Hemolysin BL-binding component [Bacillus cereus]